jgi:hypothetical protein
VTASLAPVPGPTPLDPLERRAEWRLAALVLALVAASGGVAGAEGSVARPVSAGARRSPGRAQLGPAGRRIRPPRAC